ncbi:MAG: arylesterase [Sulfuricella denitrificans]|nr:arylesterase [Sulfuricella denitrificans]
MRIRWLLYALLLIAPSAWAGQTILVFGDSLSASYGIATGAGWVSLLQQRLDRKAHDHSIVNASISGETTAGGASRIEAALDAHQPEIVIIELGANDGLRGLSLEATRRNLDSIMQSCRDHKARILLIGMRLPPNYGPAYTEGFAAIYPDLAKKYHAALLPFLLDGIAGKRDWFQADNLHPTAAAQPVIMENVWIKLKPLLQ